MAITINLSTLINGGGVSIQSPPVARTGSGGISLQEVLPEAKAGTLSTRTDDDTGTVTMSSAGHGITTGAKVDVYWTGGVQYGCTVGTVSGTAVPIDTGSGDNLPAEDSDVTVVVQTAVNVFIDGDNTKLISVLLETADKSLRTAGHVQLQDASDAEIAEIDLVANVPMVWDIEGGSANPFTGNPITKGKISQGGTVATETYTLKIVGVQDASP